MPTATSDFAVYCCEILSSAGPCTAKRMFGGWGISTDGLTIAIIANLGGGEKLWLKSDDASRHTWEAAGCERFTYTSSKGGRNRLTGHELLQRARRRHGLHPRHGTLGPHGTAGRADCQKQQKDAQKGSQKNHPRKNAAGRGLSDPGATACSTVTAACAPAPLRLARCAPFWPLPST
jgi:hypothetical protein